MIGENKNTQTNEQQSEEIVLYYYYDSYGQKYHTGSSVFASARADYYGNGNVYIEKQ